MKAYILDKSLVHMLQLIRMYNFCESEGYIGSYISLEHSLLHSFCTCTRQGSIVDLDCIFIM